MNAILARPCLAVDRQTSAARGTSGRRTASTSSGAISAGLIDRACQHAGDVVAIDAAIGEALRDEVDIAVAGAEELEDRSDAIRPATHEFADKAQLGGCCGYAEACGPNPSHIAVSRE